MREATTAAPLVWFRAFPAVPVCAREARRFLAMLLNGCPAADNAILCLSELVTNAMLHSRSRAPGGEFFVYVHRREGVLRIEVADQGGPWEPRAGGDGKGGRGLAIVSQLARAWGRAGNERTGWTIWFEMECW